MSSVGINLGSHDRQQLVFSAASFGSYPGCLQPQLAQAVFLVLAERTTALAVGVHPCDQPLPVAGVELHVVVSLVQELD